MIPTNQQLRDYLNIAKATIIEAGLWTPTLQVVHDHLIKRAPFYVAAHRCFYYLVRILQFGNTPLCKGLLRIICHLLQ